MISQLKSLIWLYLQDSTAFLENECMAIGSFHSVSDVLEKESKKRKIGLM